MRKLLKITVWTLGGLLGVLLVATVVLVLVFDPNEYKGSIAQAVKNATGRELVIDGKIGWTLFPRLGISTGKLELANAKGFGPEPFARLEATTLGVEVLPLLRGRVQVHAVVVDGLTLNLARNAAGRANWDDLAQPSAPTPEKSATPTEAGAPSADLDLFSVDSLDIRRANFHWHDAASGERHALRNVDLSTGTLAVDKPVNIRLALQVEHGKPVQRLPVELRTQATFSPNALMLNKLALRIDDSTLSGNVEIRDFANPAARFELALDRFDLDRYLPPAPGKPASAKTAADEPVVLPLGMLRALNVQGKFSVGTLRAFGIRSEDVRTQIAARGGLLQFGPNSAKLYGGQYSGTTALDVRGKTPLLKMEESLRAIRLGDFLKDAGLFENFSGRGDVALALTGAGGDADAITKTLNGTVAVALQDGTIEGIDLEKMEAQIKEARAKYKDNTIELVKALPELKPASGDRTPFGKLSASAKVENGVVLNDDLVLEAGRLRVTGAGRVDLVRRRFNDYRLLVGGVPLVFSGPFTSLPRVDWNSIAKSAIDARKEKAKTEIQQRLDTEKQKLQDRLLKKTDKKRDKPKTTE